MKMNSNERQGLKDRPSQAQEYRDSLEAEDESKAFHGRLRNWQDTLEFTEACKLFGHYPDKVKVTAPNGQAVGFGAIHHDLGIWAMVTPLWSGAWHLKIAYTLDGLSFGYQAEYTQLSRQDVLAHLQDLSPHECRERVLAKFGQIARQEVLA